jgi:hypothetical protein
LQISNLKAKVVTAGTKCEAIRFVDALFEDTKLRKEEEKQEEKGREALYIHQPAVTALIPILVNCSYQLPNQLQPR